MGYKGKKMRLKIIILVLSLIFALGAVAFAELPAENKKDVPKEERITKGLDSLVEKGVIKAEDLGKIRDYLKAERAEKRKIFEQMRNMPEDQRKEYIQNYKKDKVDVMEKMVRDKIITKEQAEEIRKIMPMHKHKDCKKKYK